MVDNVFGYSGAVRLDSLIMWDSVEAVLPGLLNHLSMPDPVLVASQSALSSPLGDSLIAFASKVVTVAGSDATPEMVQHILDAGGNGYLVFGGGTPIVAARAAAIERPGPTIIIPTTPTTAIASAGAALRDGNRRIERYDPASRPAAIIIDSLALEGTPEWVVADAALVTWCSAIWQLQGGSEHTHPPGPALRSVRLVLEARDDRRALMLAAVLSNSAGTPRAAGPAMALAHAIRLEQPKTRLGFLMLPLTLAALRKGWGNEARILAALGQSPIGAAAKLEAPLRLRDVASQCGMPRIAEHALQSALMRRYPTCDAAALTAILEDAW